MHPFSPSLYIWTYTRQPHFVSSLLSPSLALYLHPALRLPSSPGCVNLRPIPHKHPENPLLCFVLRESSGHLTHLSRGSWVHWWVRNQLPSCSFTIKLYNLDLPGSQWYYLQDGEKNPCLGSHINVDNLKRIRALRKEWNSDRLCWGE